MSAVSMPLYPGVTLMDFAGATQIATDAAMSPPHLVQQLSGGPFVENMCGAVRCLLQ